MPVRDNKNDLLSDVAAQIQNANTTTNQITPDDLSDIILSIIGLLLVTSTTATVASARLPSATDSVRGVIELATNAEAVDETDGSHAITPQSMRHAIGQYAAEAFPDGVRNDEIIDSDIPATITRDTELTGHLTGISIASGVLTITRVGQDDITITLPTGSGGGLSQAQVDARINALVQAFARDTTTDIADDKISAAIARIAQVAGYALAANPTGRMAKDNLPSDAVYDDDVDDSVIGVTISGNTLTFTRRGEPNIVITLPAGSGGDSTPVSTHQRYAAFKPGSSTFAASDFAAGTRIAASTSSAMAVSGIAQAGFLAFWSAEQLTTIRSAGGLPGENLIGSFVASRLQIGTVNGYLYVLTPSRPAATLNQNWTLE